MCFPNVYIYLLRRAFKGSIPPKVGRVALVHQLPPAVKYFYLQFGNILRVQHAEDVILPVAVGGKGIWKIKFRNDRHQRRILAGATVYIRCRYIIRDGCHRRRNRIADQRIGQAATRMPEVQQAPAGIQLDAAPHVYRARRRTHGDGRAPMHRNAVHCRIGPIRAGNDQFNHKSTGAVPANNRGTCPNEGCGVAAAEIPMEDRQVAVGSIRKTHTAVLTNTGIADAEPCMGCAIVHMNLLNTGIGAIGIEGYQPDRIIARGSVTNRTRVLLAGRRRNPSGETPAPAGVISGVVGKCNAIGSTDTGIAYGKRSHRNIARQNMYYLKCRIGPIVIMDNEGSGIGSAGRITDKRRILQVGGSGSSAVETPVPGSGVIGGGIQVGNTNAMTNDSIAGCKMCMRRTIDERNRNIGGVGSHAVACHQMSGNGPYRIEANQRGMLPVPGMGCPAREGPMPLGRVPRR